MLQRLSASLVKFKSKVQGVVVKDVNSRLSENLTVRDFGAIGDGTLHPLSERYTNLAAAKVDYPHVTSLEQSIDWAAFQAAFNSHLTTVDFRGGVYVVNSDLDCNRSVNLLGDAGSKIVMTDNFQLFIHGDLRSMPTVSVEISKTSHDVTFANPHGLKPTDVFIVHNQTDFSWSPHRAYYHEGEFLQVHTVTSHTSVKVYGLPADNYKANTLSVWQLLGVMVSLVDVCVEGSEVNATPIKIRWANGVHIRNFSGKSATTTQIEIDRCYKVDIYGGSAMNSAPESGLQYGYTIANSTDVRFFGGSHGATRHAVALGGGSGSGCVPCRNVTIVGATLRNMGSGQGSADMHGNVDNVQYIDCNLFNSADMGGRNVKLKNCTIYQSDANKHGACVIGSEIVGGTYTIEDCRMYTDGDLEYAGLIHLSMSKTLREDLTVIVRNLTVNGRSTGDGGINAKLVRVGVAQGETKKVNVDVRGVNCGLKKLAAVLYVASNYSGATPVVSDYLIVDDIYAPAGCYLLYPVQGILSVPTRQMTQHGHVDGTTPSGATYLITDYKLFRYYYSKVPDATCGIGTVDGSSLNYMNANALTTRVLLRESQRLRCAVFAEANMVAGQQLRFSYTAGISEV